MARDIFSTHSIESDWEWAEKRRTIFKTPQAGAWAGVGTFVVGMVIRGMFRDPNWLTTSLVAGLVAVVVALGAPKAETALIWLRRHRIRLEELKESQSANVRDVPGIAPPAAPTPSAAAIADSPEAEVTFDCDRTGRARLRVTNTGAGAWFSATIQPYGLTADAVNGQQIIAQWEIDGSGRQRLARGDTRVIRLASVYEIGHGVRAWALHRGDAADIKGIEAVEVFDVALVADPDLDEPCHLQFSVNTNGECKMARVGVAPSLFRAEPQRVNDMRRLLAEAAEYVRGLEYFGDTSAVIHVSIVVKRVVPNLLVRAFGIRVPAVYARELREAGELAAQSFCVAFLVRQSQRVTEEDIDRSFPLPMTWVEFYESDPARQWPLFD